MSPMARAIDHAHEMRYAIVWLQHGVELQTTGKEVR